MAQVRTSNSSTSFIGMTLMTAVLGLSACTPTHPDVKARQDMMKNYGDATKIMGGMVKEPDTFDIEVFREQAAFLDSESKTPWSHFEDSEAVGNAKPDVWSNNTDFISASEDFQKAAAELNMVAQNSTTLEEVKPAFGAVGKSCKSCHDDYQVKKDD